MKKLDCPLEVHGFFTSCLQYRYDAFDQPEVRYETLFRDACERSTMRMLAIGVVSDHVHLLVRFNAAESPGNAMRLLKGSVSRLFSEKHREIWREMNGKGLRVRGYHYRRISERSVPAIIRYCNSQYDVDGVGKPHKKPPNR